MRLTSTTFCQPSSGMSSGVAPQTMPALLTSTSTAPKSVDCSRDDGLNLLRVADVAAEPERLHPELLRELGGRLLATVGLAGAEDDVRAGFGKALGHLAADALAAAGHDRRLAAEIEQLHVSSLRRRRGASPSRGSRSGASSHPNPSRRPAGPGSDRVARRARARRSARRARRRPRLAACRRGRGPGSALPRPRTRSSRRGRCRSSRRGRPCRRRRARSRAGARRVRARRRPMTTAGTAGAMSNPSLRPKGAGKV